MEPTPAPTPSASESQQLLDILASLRSKFVSYQLKCQEKEQQAAAKRRYDSAEAFRLHGECWMVAASDLDLAINAFSAGRTSGARSPASATPEAASEATRS